MASSSHLLFRPTPPPPTILKPLSILSTFLKPLPSAAGNNAISSPLAVSSLSVRLLSSPSPRSFLSHSLAPFCSLPTSSFPLYIRYNHALSAADTPVEALDSAEEVDEEEEDDDGVIVDGKDALPEANEEEIVGESEEENRIAVPVTVEMKKVPKLSVKEKKELASYARRLGDKLKTQQIGKSGVTANVYFALNEMLEANELLKLKVHNTCPDELEDVVKKLEQGTGSAAVSQVGRTVIFYRPSLSKLKEVEKKKEAAIAKSQNETRFDQRRRDQRSTESSYGRSYESSRGRGTESRRGRGTESSHGRDSESSYGRGTESRRGRGSESSHGRDSESSYGRGTESRRGRGTESSYGRGTESSRGRSKYSTPSRSRY